MRYRRYYTSKNRDGSRTVVSYGPLAAYYVIIGKMICLFWPLGLTGLVHGWVGWLISIPAEIAWLVFLASIQTNKRT